MSNAVLPESPKQTNVNFHRLKARVLSLDRFRKPVNGCEVAQKAQQS